MKGAVWKSIDRKYVCVPLVEPTSKLVFSGTISDQLLTRIIPQTKPNPIRLSRTNPLSHFFRIELQPAKGLLPGFSAVDVGAVTQVNLVLQSHQEKGEAQSHSTCKAKDPIPSQIPS